MLTKGIDGSFYLFVKGKPEVLSGLRPRLLMDVQKLPGARLVDGHNVRIYNPRTDSWSAGPDMPTARASLAAASVGGAIYAIGGLAGLGQPNLDVVEGLLLSVIVPSPPMLRGRLENSAGNGSSSLVHTIPAADRSTSDNRA